MFMEVLVEGGADVPTVREILERRFNLKEDINLSGLIEFHHTWTLKIRSPLV